jgi:hypothetical protein
MALGIYKTLATNSITYQKFAREHCYVAGWDLTNNLEAGVDPYHVPSVRSGQVRLECQFNEKPKEDLSMIVYSEVSQLMVLKHPNKPQPVAVSYSPN